MQIETSTSSLKSASHCPARNRESTATRYPSVKSCGKLSEMTPWDGLFSDPSGFLMLWIPEATTFLSSSVTIPVCACVVNWYAIAPAVLAGSLGV